MRRAVLLAVTFLALTATAAMAQAAGSTPSKRSAHNTSSGTAASTGTPDRALMQRIWEGWQSLDPTKVAQFYDKAPGDVFFDITPLKYNGWDDYAKGTAALRDMFTSAKFALNDDARVERLGDNAYGTATVNAQLTNKKGEAQKMILRWTVIWAKRGGQWLIVHEHVSAPTQ
jgi:ketosteroid isomerase-like protein